MMVRDGMIVGAGGIGYVMKKIEHNKLLKVSTLLLAASMIAMGIPLFTRIINFSATGYSVFYSVVMFLFGVIISFIDIPIIYYLQTGVPSQLRGRVMSIGIAGAKVIAPIGLLLSGILVDVVVAYSLPVYGGIILFVGTLLLVNF